MTQDVNPRRQYVAPQRAGQAAATRRAVLAAARDLFIRRGYAATTVAAIAAQAEVAVDTVYASVGRKPVLLRELVETAISGADHAIPGAERDYVARMLAVPTARAKLAIYAQAVVAIQQRLAPVFIALRDAATVDPACAKLWAEVSQRRARNMRDLAADLRSTGELRDDLTDGQIADIIWSMNAAEYWALMVIERGWTPRQFGDWLIDAWKRLLLESP
ncbi:MAG: TetR family transcriptional regulator [Actinomycetota bacterium]|nr:TetR family transcriptional regulator [Actinomycetota bacterium]